MISSANTSPARRVEPLALKVEAPSPKQNHIPPISVSSLKARDFAEGIKKTNRDGSLLVSVCASDYREVMPTILHWIPYITVKEPGELRKQIQEAVDWYRKKV